MIEKFKYVTVRRYDGNGNNLFLIIGDPHHFHIPLKEMSDDDARDLGAFLDKAFDYIYKLGQREKLEEIRKVLGI